MIDRATNTAVGVLVVFAIIGFIFPDYAKWIFFVWVAMAVIMLFEIERRLK